MITNTVKLIAIVALALLLLPATFAQQGQTQTKQTESQFVDFSGFKGQIFDIKNRDPLELVRILYPLGSGFKGATMQANIEYRTITVRDFPENIATIAEAIKRLDVPLPPKPPRPTYPDIEVIAHVLIASNEESAGNPTPQALADVIKQLQASLNFKSYQLLTSFVQRTRFEGGNIEAKGLAVMPDKTLIGKYHLRLMNIGPDTRQGDTSQISIGQLEFYLDAFNELEKYQVDTRINTKLSVRDGEKVVVGTASMRDKVGILVLTTKILK